MNSFDSQDFLRVGNIDYSIFRLDQLEKSGLGEISRLPYSIRVLLENLLRHEDNLNVRSEDICALAQWSLSDRKEREIAFKPARVLMQDFTGVPAIVDLAAMRDALQGLGGDPSQINPRIPVDLIIDHSIQVDRFASNDAYKYNSDMEFERNQERYAFLRWGQQSFQNFRVVPPATGICHQVNLEYLAQVVFTFENGRGISAYPDTLVGTDSHTTMINGLGVVGWGVGGIEAEAAMLGQPIFILIPEVVGFRFTGALRKEATATDLVLVVTQMLRKKGVVGKFVEYFGPGLSSLSLADRATIANMSPEYGATAGFFPVDKQTLVYLRATGRSDQHVNLVETYTKEQRLFREDRAPDPEYNETLELDLSSVEPSVAGPKRPQDRVSLRDVKSAFATALMELGVKDPKAILPIRNEGREFRIHNGCVVIAALTSCTNTSNPAVMIGAGLLAKKAVKLGLKTPPWVKTSLAPGSKVVTDYLKLSGLMYYLNELGFNLVGYGCTTCIGNSGPLPEYLTRGIKDSDLVTVAVLSGNRNFEGRINPYTRGNYLMSPLLVVAFALAGRMDIDLLNEPLGYDSGGNPVMLSHLWPEKQEIQDVMRGSVKKEMFAEEYAEVFVGDERWHNLKIPEGDLYDWNIRSTYIKKPPFFENMTLEPEPLKDIVGARVLVMAEDSLTTDHISPAGAIPVNDPAGQYLIKKGITQVDFNSFGSRRGNHEIMLRGTFGNIRLKNLLTDGKEGGWTVYLPDRSHTSIYEASIQYRKQGIPLIVLAGKEYGTGSSRDWAAKGTMLLGVKAVLAESFERIHRSNLIGMGVLPLQFLPGESYRTLGLTGHEIYGVLGIAAGMKPGSILQVTAKNSQKKAKIFSMICRMDTPEELKYYCHQGILRYVIRQLLTQSGING